MEKVLVAAVISISDVPYKLYKYMTCVTDNEVEARQRAFSAMPELEHRLSERQPPYCMDVIEDMIYVFRLKECYSTEDAVGFIQEVDREIAYYMSEARWFKSLSE